VRRPLAEQFADLAAKLHTQWLVEGSTPFSGTIICC
jgi:hypothetical protein